MKNRKMTGRYEDLREATSRLTPDPHATGRIYRAVDWEVVEFMRKRRLEAALSLLSRRDREFARRILEGLTWANSCMSKSQFNRRLKKIINFFRACKHWLK